GASTALATLAHALGQRGDWRVVAIDATGGLTALADPCACDMIAAAWDHESVRRLLEGLLPGRGIQGGPAQEPSGIPAPHTMLLVDGFGAFEELQQTVNRGWATEALVSLALRGRARGVVVGISARRRSEVPPALANVLAERILLRCTDEDEATLLDAPAALADPDLPPGRAWVRGHWAQIARVDPPDRTETKRTETPVAEPPRLPTSVTLDSLTEAHTRRSPHSDEPSGWCLPVGVGASRLEAVHLDLTRAHALVTGTPRSGCSTTLDTLAAGAARIGLDALRFEGASSLHALRRALETPRQTLVLVDGFDRWLEDPDIESVFDQCLDSVDSGGVRVVATVDATSVLRCYSPTLARLRAMRTGLVLGPDASSRGDVLHHELPPREDLPDSPGRGWLTTPTGAEPVQVARP
ncbi:MAG: hypothetical protein ACK5O2_10805, partial [Microthrixaceae bacterium]